MIYIIKLSILRINDASFREIRKWGRTRIPSIMRGLFIQLMPADSINPATQIPSTSPPASFNHADSVHLDTRIHSTSPPGSFNPGHADSLNRNPRHDSFNPHRLLCSTHHGAELTESAHAALTEAVSGVDGIRRFWVDGNGEQGRGNRG